MDVTAGGHSKVRVETTKGLAAFDYTSVSEATIENLDDHTKITCHFRPQEYSFAKSNQWEETKAIGVNFAPPKYQSTSPYKLTMELWFDTNESDGPQDVREVTAELWKMMRLAPDKQSPNTFKSVPPTVQFQWGTMWAF